MDGGSAKIARLHGCRRYDSMDGIGRVESGTETESNAGAVTEEQISAGQKRIFTILIAHLNLYRALDLNQISY